MSYGKDVHLFTMIEKKTHTLIFKSFKEVYVLFMDYLMYRVI